jgi:hypothetical protein
MPMLSFKFRLNETRRQRREVDEMLGDFCWLYNSGLHERIEAFRPTANACSQTVPGTWVDRKGKKREGYVREHLAKIPTNKARRVTYKSQACACLKCGRNCPTSDDGRRLRNSKSCASSIRRLLHSSNAAAKAKSRASRGSKLSANVLHLRAFGFLAWNSPLKSFQCDAA